MTVPRPGAAGPPDTAMAAMAAMAMTALRGLSMDARVSLERALTLQLQDLPAPAQLRVAELGALAELLIEHGEEYDDPQVLRQLASELYHLERHRKRLPVDERHLVDEEIRSLRKRSRHRVGTPVVEAGVYDRLRPEGSPPADTLTRRYGGWLKACRAAYGLQPDGSTTGPGRPWAIPVQPTRGVPLYSDDGCIDAIRRCARALLRVPTTEGYRTWQRAQRQRQPGRLPSELSLPDVGTVLSLFGTWEAVLDAAAISQHELAELRAARVPAAVSNPLEVADRRATLLGGTRFGQLNLADAVAIAAEAQVSLEWLAGDDNTSAPPPPAGATLSASAIRDRRAQTKVRDDALARAAKLTVGQWRQALAGRRDLTARQVLDVARLLRCATADLVSS